MIRKSTMVCVMSVLLAVTAQAQIDDGPDGIGIYADLEGMVNNLYVSEGVIELYVLATNVAATNGIIGWEMGLEWEGPAISIGWDLPYEAAAGVQDEWSFQIACYDLLPPAPVVHLMTLYYHILDEGTSEFFIRECWYSEGGIMGNYLPAYIDGFGGELRALNPSSGSIGLPCFRLNGEAPVAVESRSWSDVKAMFR